MARHYGTAVVPARPAKPKDKAKVERAVQIAQRWILARLRNETFFSLDALNARIAELLEDVNARKMRVYGASRNELFERLEKNALLLLPQDRFTYAEWKTVKVNRLDYHVDVEGHYYSAPHTMVGEMVGRGSPRPRSSFTCTPSASPRTCEAARAAGTRRNPNTCRRPTRNISSGPPARITHWAASMGPQTKALVEAILADRPHPEMGYRSCLGILRLGKKFRERLEPACARALFGGARSYKSVASILKLGLDRLPLPTAPEPQTSLSLGAHENVRGPGYYQH